MLPPHTVRRGHAHPVAVATMRDARFEKRRWLLGLALVVATAVMALAISMPVQGADRQDRLPPFREIEKLTYTRFGTDGRQMTDLITRQAAEELFAEIGKLGWEIRDAKKLLEHVPDESDFFVQQLRSQRGRAFMRDIATMPLGYDRVDRISHLDRGHRFIRDLVKGPDGYKLIQYMTETPWGKNMGKQLRDAPDGANFNKPTGRIYTAEQLLAVLHDSYDAEVKRRAQANTQASR